jgi:hypothetical protein
VHGEDLLGLLVARTLALLPADAAALLAIPGDEVPIALTASIWRVWASAMTFLRSMRSLQAPDAFSTKTPTMS